MTQGFKVIIAGGGIAGLTLANALEQGGIDYVLLERRNEMAPQVGASIGIMPNGCRIMDQLGCIKSLENAVEPIKWMQERDGTGKPISDKSDISQLNLARSGYGIAFGDRQKILEIFYENLKDKSKCLTGKSLLDVQHLVNGIKVTCADGTTYAGDVLVGADGVNSKVRNEMWRLADEEDPELVKMDKECLSSEYQCLFGIASASAGLTIGNVEIGCERQRSSLTIIGKDDRTYYFIFRKLDKKYKLADLPRYSEADKAAFVKEHADMIIGDDVRFEDIHKHTVSSTLVALEEADMKVWTWGRIACIGDGCHKMTPNAGLGGNNAMESAVALANSLKKMLDSSSEHPTQDRIVAALKGYQDSRKVRASAAIKASNLLTNVQAMRTNAHAFFAYYCIPVLGGFMESLGADNMIGATRIDYLPVPERSAVGTMPFNPEQGEGQKESKLKRALLALPFIALSLYGLRAIDLTPAMPALNNILEAGKINAGGLSVPIQQHFYQMKWLDSIWSTINTAFTPAVFGYDAIGRSQLLSFLTDFGVILSIWAIEAVRRGSLLTPAQLPGVFTMIAQLGGIGVVAPIYYALHYILTPIETFRATDSRLTKMNYTCAILPAVLLTYYLPLLASFFHPTLYTRQSFLFIWQMFPLWFYLAQTVISKLFPDTIRQDRLQAPKRDLNAIRFAVGTTIAISASVWLWTTMTSSASLVQTFLPDIFVAKSTDLVLCVRNLLQWDHVLLFGSTFLWLGLQTWDAKHAGMVRDSWAKIAGIAMVSLLTLGPGATAGLAWLWREEVITHRRHRAAVTKDKWEVEVRTLGRGVKGEKSGEV